MPDAKPARALRILVADDDKRLVHVITMYLEMEGFGVHGTFNGRGALDAADRETFDLAILDVMMPDVDGIEVCRRLRADPRTQRMPVILFTSLSSDSDLSRAREAGANHLITKPYNLTGLGGVVRRLLAETAEK